MFTANSLPASAASPWLSIRCRRKAEDSAQANNLNLKTYKDLRQFVTSCSLGHTSPLVTLELLCYDFLVWEGSAAVPEQVVLEATIAVLTFCIH